VERTFHECFLVSSGCEARTACHTETALNLLYARAIVTSTPHAHTSARSESGDHVILTRGYSGVNKCAIPVSTSCIRI